MLVSGFTFVRNAIKYDYPVVEAIKSILPLCHEVVVAVGNSGDGTLALIQSIADPRIKIIETIWDDTLRAGGQVLAQETDKAFRATSAQSDWCIYIQADEIMHESDLAVIRASMLEDLTNQNIEGLLFDYLHFYGSYDYLGVARQWYRKEIRVIRNLKGIKSWRDAQGFRWHDGQKLKVVASGGRIFHYGWVKHPEQQQAKQANFDKLWHDDATVQARVGTEKVYQYNGKEPLHKYTGSHPKVMHYRIALANWQFASDPTQVKWSLKERLSYWIEKRTGWRPGEYRNYVMQPPTYRPKPGKGGDGGGID
jgi:glycosyltransferase involved in cell wall biosynthesis